VTGFLERALAAGEERADPKVLTDMYFWIAFLRRSRGETPESNPELNRAIERAAEIGAALGDPVSQAIPSAFMAAGMIFTGEFRQGARQMEAALDIVADHVDPFSAAILGGLLTIANARLGDFAAAERNLAPAARLPAAECRAPRRATRNRSKNQRPGAPPRVYTPRRYPATA